tara:strand:+ start:58 stop:447 length:390 start_codon:yes stop_codon:yes gene_type:complete
MIAYNIFNGNPVQRQASPLEPGVWLMPANATDIEPPTYDPSTQTCQFNGGEWIVEEIITEETLPEETIDPWVDLRMKRDFLLAQSDWRMSIDYPYGDQEQWISYRELLRDLPAVTSDPENPVWPTAPSN